MISAIIPELYSSQYIGGTSLIVIGGLLLIKAIFTIHIPIFRLLFGGLLLYAGIELITNGTSYNQISRSLFSSNTYQCTPSNNAHAIVLNQTTVDFTAIDKHMLPLATAASVAFGYGTILINPKIPTTILIQSAFSHVTLPDGTRLSFGTHTYTNHSSSIPTQLTIHVRVVGGVLTIVEKQK